MIYGERIFSIVITISFFLIPITVKAQCMERDITGTCAEHRTEATTKVQPQTIDPKWGTSSTMCKSIHASTFTPYDSSVTWGQDGYSWIYRMGGMYWFDANVDIPTGARVLDMYVNVEDSSATDDVYAWLSTCQTDHSLIVSYPIDDSLKTTDSPGIQRLHQNFSGDNIIIDNFNKSYFVRVRLEATNLSNKFGSIQICYALQVSPDPASATFSDVPIGHWAHQYVEALYASGITEGYSDGTFRPGQPVLRGQMAAFLSKALGLHWPY
jgi:hypothetical protein